MNEPAPAAEPPARRAETVYVVRAVLSVAAGIAIVEVLGAAWPIASGFSEAWSYGGATVAAWLLLTSARVPARHAGPAPEFLANDPPGEPWQDPRVAPRTMVHAYAGVVGIALLPWVVAFTLKWDGYIPRVDVQIITCVAAAVLLAFRVKWAAIAYLFAGLVLSGLSCAGFMGLAAA